MALLLVIGDVAKVEFGSEIRQGAVTMSRKNAAGDIESLRRKLSRASFLNVWEVIRIVQLKKLVISIELINQSLT